MPQLIGTVSQMARFEIRLSRNKKYYFVLIAANGEIVLQSEMYESKQGAHKGIYSIKSNYHAEIVDDSEKYKRR
jgi:uncharacterized protein YegP (UPF0339 family)